MTDAEQADILLKSIRDAVMADALLERDQLAEQTETKLAAELEKAHNEISGRMDYYIQSETEKIRNAWNQKISQHAMEYRNALLHIRDEIKDEVFSQATDRMREFVASEAYGAYFTALLKRHERVFAGRRFVFEVGTADMVRGEEIRAACPGSEVCENPELRLGGFVATEHGGALRVVETTESRLDRLREHFSEYADYGSAG